MKLKEVLSKEKLEALVNSGQRPKTIAKQIGWSVSRISALCREYGIKLKSNSTNHEYFRSWSSNMAYVLGFLTADGNIHKKKPYITVELKRADEEVLIFILGEINSTGKIHHYEHYDKRSKKTYQSSLISIYSKKVVHDLNMLGVFPNKTGKHRINFDIPKEYRPDYIRGFFDGDGSAYLQNGLVYSQFSCQSMEFLIDLHSILEVGKIRDGKPPYLFLCSSESKHLEELMYNGNFCLKRKKEVFESSRIPKNFISKRK
jgi:intein-encoded DNA endonuclease-like protein